MACNKTLSYFLKPLSTKNSGLIWKFILRKRFSHQMRWGLINLMLEHRIIFTKILILSQ
jgi:hypothetical protein